MECVASAPRLEPTPNHSERPVELLAARTEQSRQGTRSNLTVSEVSRGGSLPYSTLMVAEASSLPRTFETVRVMVLRPGVA